ncbi:calcium-activated BK potassium channel [Tieghemostelium lacteum]|uniref:Calcium-activated BK potassium channel n=1 Tax=Tieghemostelium lacteum TaxID=361077 RepID=A0A152A9S3_TIELA|nr:calcium-activated BK potassium channel [Tieghemostelium lacteum]|eukprot:KYR02970.1 calcium-activated BK potassium channel [Tieghemostelium lacteum]
MAKQPIGARAIWNNIVTLLLFLAFILLVLSLAIIITRLLRRKQQKTYKLSFRSKLEIYLAYTHIGEFIEFAQVLFSVISVLLFIYGTYMDKAPFAYNILEIVLIFFFFLHWSLDFFITKDKLRYLFSFFSIIDMITILPILIDIKSGDLSNILDTFQFLRVLRVVRILRLSRVLHYFKNEVTKYTFKAFIVVFSFIMVLAGFYMNIETLPNGQYLQFHETVYFLVITLATVGYGDIYPTTALGQITITLALSIGAGVLIPYHISALMEKLQQDSPFLRNLSSSGITGHVVLSGDITMSHLLDFLGEFYHERYGKLKKELVILCPNPPDDKMKALLLHPFYKNRLVYLIGSPLFEQDLQRTKISKAEACFLMSPAWDSGDTDNILCSYAVKSMNRNIKIFSHLVTSKNQNKSPFLKGTLYQEEFRSALLAQSIICPGYNVLFSNLFTSRNIPSVVSQKWLTEYYYGCNHSVYVLGVPEFLIGEMLSDVILSMYFGNGSLLLGLFIPTDEEVQQQQQQQQQKKKFMHQSSSYVELSGGSYAGINVGAANNSSSTSRNSNKIRGKFYMNPPNNTVLRESMSLVLISHTVYKSKDFQSRESKTYGNGLYGGEDNLYQEGYHYLRKKIGTLFNKLAVPDLELLINEIDQPGTSEKSQDQVMNESLKSFIGGRSKSIVNLVKQQSLVSIPTQDQLSEELENESIFDFKGEDEEELSPKELIRNLCLQEYSGDWIALLSDISSQKTQNPRTEKILERIRFIIDKHSLMTFTLYGKYDKKAGTKQMKGHMLIICNSVRGLDLLLNQLRLPYVSTIKNSGVNSKSGVQPIVILYKQQPEESWFSSIKTLPLIAFIHGSSSNNVDLVKCGAKSAETIIIASNPYERHGQENLVDSFTLTSYIDIIKCNNQAKIIIELIHEPNIRFLEDKNLKAAGCDKKFHTYLQATQEKTFMKPEFFSTPYYASGNVATYTVLDSIACQSHYHESINTVAHELIYGVNGLSQSFSSFLGSNCNQYCNPDSKTYSRLIPLPAAYQGRTYGELFKNFLQLKNYLCLGLYRSKDPLSAPAPYVYTCPHSSTVLNSKDQIYIISRDPIQQ